MQYKPRDDHWQSRLAAIEGRPDPEPEPDACRYCGQGLTQDESDEWEDVCFDCAERERLAEIKKS